MAEPHLHERIERVLELLDEIPPDAGAVTEAVRPVRYIRTHTHCPGR